MPGDETESKSILEHIGELRKKVSIAVVALIIGTIIGHIFHKKIIAFLLAPAGNNELIFLSPIEPIIFIFKIDFIIGIIISFPVLVWSLFSYITPSLPKKTTSLISIFYIASFVLLIIALIYAFFVTIPISLKFLFSIIIPGIENQFSAQNYLSFFITQTLIIIAIFQIPILITGGVYFNLFKTKFLSSKRRYIYILLLIGLAILTPTADIFSLSIVLLPCITIFEGSLLITKIFEHHKERNRVKNP